MTENTAAKRPKKIMFLMPKDTPKIVFFLKKVGIYGGIYATGIYASDCDWDFAIWS